MLRLAGCVGLFLLLTIANGQELLIGRVVAITDGDTFTLLNAENQQVRIRIAEIDTPERGQPFGSKATGALSALIFNKEVRVVVQTIDRYGRTVGRPYVGNVDISREMVRLGAAWVYRDYVTDQSLFAVEDDARANNRGIWGLSESERMPPWEWRRRGTQQAAPSGCAIKGNIGSGGDRIYHVSESPWYSRTIIDESKGERWFCSEEEAKAAGWRAPRN